MVKEWAAKWLAKQRKTSSEPWASFEVTGFEKDGRIKVGMDWNDAFVKQIHDLGFHAETEEDSVQLFFYTAQARPTHFGNLEEDPAVAAEHPNLRT